MGYSKDLTKYPHVFIQLWERAYMEGGLVYECSSTKAAHNLRGQLNGFRKALSYSEQHEATARKFDTLMIRIDKKNPKTIIFVIRSDTDEVRKIEEFISSKRT